MTTKHDSLHANAMANRCLECSRLVGTSPRRGLCGRCYSDPTIAGDYPTLPRGAWRMVGRAWDAVEVSVLVSLFREGFADHEIAASLERSVGSVCKKRQRLGLASSPARQAVSRMKANRVHDRSHP